MMTDKKQDNRIQIKLDKWKYVVNLLICVFVDSGIRLLFFLSLPVAGGDSGRGANRGQCPLNSESGPPCGPRQGVCINNTMTDFLQ